MNDNVCLMVMWYKKKTYQAVLQNKEKLRSLCNQNEKIKFAQKFGGDWANCRNIWQKTILVKMLTRTKETGRRHN